MQNSPCSAERSQRKSSQSISNLHCIHQVVVCNLCLSLSLESRANNTIDFAKVLYCLAQLFQDLLVRIPVSTIMRLKQALRQRTDGIRIQFLQAGEHTRVK